MDLTKTDYELGLFLASPRPAPVIEAPACPIPSSSAVALTPKREVKGARRVRNACLQCRERKIRCSRTYPCKGCISRGDGAGCDWQGGFPSGNIPVHHQHVAEQRRQIEELKDRIIFAKALISAATEQDLNLQSEIGHSRTKKIARLPTLLRENELAWFATGSNNQPPGSSASNISNFSTSTCASSQCWSNDENTAASPLSSDFNDNVLKEYNLFDSLHMRHKHGTYRSLNLLREEDGKLVEISRSYSNLKEKLTPASSAVDGSPCATQKSSIPSSYSLNFPPETYTRGEQIPEQNTMSWFGVPGLRDRAISTDQGVSNIDQFALAASLGAIGTNWLSTRQEYQGRTPFWNSGCDQRRRNVFDLESGSPITPGRHSQHFTPSYFPSVRTNDETPSNELRNPCQQYLPPRQYLTEQNLKPEPVDFDFHNLPWGADLPPNPRQGIQADSNFSLANMRENCGLLPSGIGLASLNDTTTPVTYNQNPVTNWLPFPS